MSEKNFNQENTYLTSTSPNLYQELVTILTSHKTELKVDVGNYKLEGFAIPQTDSAVVVFQLGEKQTSTLLDVNVIHQSELSCRFTYKNDLYTFKTTGQARANEIHIKIPSDIFKLQRRQNFRIYFSSDIPHQVHILNASHYQTSFINISLTGCQLAVKNMPIEQIKEQFNEAQPIQIKINLFNFYKTMSGFIRFIKESEKNDYILIGIEFEKLSSEVTQEWQKAIFAVDRHNRQINE